MKHLALIVTLATVAGPPSLTQIPRWGAGALHFERLDVGPQEPLPEELTIEARPNGHGSLRIRPRALGEPSPPWSYRDRGQTLSLGSRSGNRRNGSSVIRVISRPPKSSSARKVRLPPNDTSTGQVSTAVTLSVIRLLAIGLIGGPCGAN